MIRSELFKLRHHRTPALLAGLFGLFMLAAPIWFVFQPPGDPADYLLAFTAVFTLAGSLIAAIYGGWIVGHEYRQGTLRRVVGIDARRGRLLAVKAGIGLVTLVAATAAAAAIGVGATEVVAAVHGDALVYDGLFREILGGAFTIGIVGAVAFALSTILRSDVYAMLGALAVMVMFGPLLQLIPTFGDYVPSAVTTQVSNWIAGAEVPSDISLTTAAATLTATMGAAAAAALALFRRRDV